MIDCQFLASFPLRRTTMENTFIHINQKLPSFTTTIYTINCKTSPDVYFIDRTIVFFVPSIIWTLGSTYTVSMTEGVATEDQYCGLEADDYSGKRNFQIYA